MGNRYCYQTQILIFILSLFASNIAYAHSGAMGIVKERMDKMDALKKDMKVLRDMTKKRNPFDQTIFNKHFSAVKKGSKDLLLLFPENSLKHPSEAKKTIWTNWNDFKIKADQFYQAIDQLEKIKNSGDLNVLNQQIKKIGKTCLSCHKKFREKRK